MIRNFVERKMPGGYNFRKEFRNIARNLSISEPPGQFNEKADYAKTLDLKNNTQHLVVNAVPTEPFAAPIDCLLAGKRWRYFVKALAGLAEHIHDIYVVIDESEKELIEFIAKNTRDCRNIYIYPVAAVYPQDHPVILMRTIFGGHIKTPKILKGNYTVRLFTEIITVEQLLQAYFRAHAQSLGTIITLTFWNKNRWQQNIVNVHDEKFIDLLLACQKKFSNLSTHNCRVVTGGVLAGREMEMADYEKTLAQDMSPIVIIPTGNTRDFMPNFQKHLWSFLRNYTTTNTHGEERPCVNCSWCDDICPVKLRVKAIYESLEEKRLKEVERLGLFDCVECGLCAYRCPAKIELLEKIKEAKENLVKGGEDNV